MKPTSKLVLLGACVIGLVGCLDAETDPPDLAERSDGPLAARRDALFGRVRAGSTSPLELQLENTGRSEIIVRAVRTIPPDPYDVAFAPPEPCGLPDPRHNPPSDLTARLIVPCVMPASASALSLGLTPSQTGGFAAGIQIDYATADGASYTLVVPATACVVR